MSETKHTLGPWKAAPARQGIIDVFDAHDHDVVTLYGGRMGNAQLIAAAPELLDAVRDLLKLHEAHHNSIEHAAARKAVAKAMGAASVGEHKAGETGTEPLKRWWPDATETVAE